MIQWHTGAKRVETLAFAPDGQLLASASYQGQVVKLWRPDGTAVGRLSCGWLVQAVAFSPDGRHLAVGGGSVQGHLYDVATWTKVAALDSQAGLAGLAFAPAGRALVGLGWPGVQWWDDPAAADRPARFADRTFDLDAIGGVGMFGASSLAFAPDGRRLVANGSDGAAVLDAPPTRLLRQVPHAGTFTRTCVAVSAAGWVAASHGRDIDAWPLDGDAPPATLPGTKRSRSVRGMTFTPDGQLLAAGSDGLARLWDPAGGLVREWDFGLRNVQSVAVAPDGLTAAVGGHDGRITVWDL